MSKTLTIIRGTMTEKQLLQKEKRAAKKAEKKRINLINNERIQERKKSTPSKGEQRIINFLRKRKIRYTREHCFGDIKAGPYTLFMDIFCRDYKLVIEYDGIHHYVPVYGNEQLLKTQRLDKIKDKVCAEYKYKVLRISYLDFDRIEEVLFEAISKMQIKAKFSHQHIDSFPELHPSC
jgi:very-short-patch-repair endonuclease